MRTIKTLFPALVLAGFAAVALSAQQPTPNPAPAPGSTPAQQPTTQPQSTPAQPAPGSVPETQAPTPPTQQNNSEPAAQPAQSTANAPEAENEQLRPVTGELEKKLDTKNAKAGDPVVVKTTEKATIADGIEIPKGSKIMGHVTDVQAHSSSNENARVTLQFDQAQLKGGQTLPIRTVLESVAPAQMNVQPTDTLNSTSPMGTPGPSTGTSGSMAGRPAGSSTSSPSMGSSASAPSMAGGAPTMSSGTQDQGANAASKAGTVVARQGNVDIKTTSVPGVLLATNANGQPFSNAAGALLGAKQNVHLDGGTEIVLAVMDAGPKR